MINECIVKKKEVKKTYICSLYMHENNTILPLSIVSKTIKQIYIQ